MEKDELREFIEEAPGRHRATMKRALKMLRDAGKFPLTESERARIQLAKQAQELKMGYE